MKRIYHIVLSVWLSLLLLFGSTAKEFLHLFAGHEDAVDHQVPGKGLSFERQHHHCSFLGDSLPAFVSQPPQLFVHPAWEMYAIRHFSLYQACFPGQTTTTSFRGPPSA